MYDDIENEYNVLLEKGVTADSINEKINKHIEELFDKYRYYSSQDDARNREQLSKIVSPAIIDIVDVWLKNTEHVLKRKFKLNTFYGLCLHISSIINFHSIGKRKQNVEMDLIKKYPFEYKESIKLAQLIEERFNLELPKSEVVIILMFLVEPEQSDKDKGNPAILYVLHGNGAAKALKETTSALSHNKNIYSYDMHLEESVDMAYKRIKKLILDIDQGAGILVIYDMGSLRDIFEMVEKETNVKLRKIQIPITMLGIELAHRSQNENDIDYIYRDVMNNFNNFLLANVNKEELIITLCHTGEGGAIQIKNYIEKNSKYNYAIKAMNISDRSELIKKVAMLQRVYNIKTFVGTYNPQILGIPFIPVSDIFSNSENNLDRILNFKPVMGNEFDYEQIYNYFSEEFKYTNINKVKKVVPQVLDDLSRHYKLDLNQQIGLFTHLGSLIERILSGEKLENYSDSAKINELFQEDYAVISKSIRKMEKTFNIIINDNEIATLIKTVKKI